MGIVEMTAKWSIPYGIAMLENHGILGVISER